MIKQIGMLIALIMVSGCAKESPTTPVVETVTPTNTFKGDIPSIADLVQCADAAKTQISLLSTKNGKNISCKDFWVFDTNAHNAILQMIQNSLNNSSDKIKTKIVGICPTENVLGTCSKTDYDEQNNICISQYVMHVYKSHPNILDIKNKCSTVIHGEWENK